MLFLRKEICTNVWAILLSKELWTMSLKILIFCREYSSFWRRRKRARCSLLLRPSSLCPINVRSKLMWLRDTWKPWLNILNFINLFLQMRATWRSRIRCSLFCSYFKSSLTHLFTSSRPLSSRQTIKWSLSTQSSQIYCRIKSNNFHWGGNQTNLTGIKRLLVWWKRLPIVF